MKQQLQLPDSAAIHLLLGCVMAALWGLFAYRHMLAFHNTGDWSYLMVCISETLTATFFVFRSAPATVSADPLDWLFALAGTFTPLFFAPASWGLLPAAKALVFVGIGMQIFGLLSLNRSFALVAAKRKIKTRGMYRLVRHPLYASYWVIFTGYILANTTWMNFVLYVMTMGFLFVRLVREEKHLALDPAYGQYMQQVRYRVIPFVF
ncbi:methyltransferase family protein [Noviherbaspirillum sedimenti]|uniref:Isoprenylcysteine carboxylmethyltransferase family protein n=1 Tax=Noviherbaspirillum sedimenti TaxID=2320865 RepID=A0A3A3GQE1_9BURK|nr:isoprenylcysteine carboxylmethyltransferase family protein [Noviherbaspirillum sedimenti]RJG04566.1 isoprenylcysteine carboxylmethyltransferase family protein [Noviherbaspirillum sedimenti]